MFLFWTWGCTIFKQHEGQGNVEQLNAVSECYGVHLYYLFFLNVFFILRFDTLGFYAHFK